MQFPSKIYIDGGDPEETRKADAMLKKAGYHGLDGQTTNPSLIAKIALREKGEGLSEKEAFAYYRKTVEEMSKIIPDGKISIQVIGDPVTMTVEDILSQARDRMLWIPNGIIKIPCLKTGLEAASIFCQEGPINITLNFTQSQAAAVYCATKTHNYDVYISPFVGRLDDIGIDGMDVVANTLAMYRGMAGESNHVQIITASVRNIKHLLYALWLKSDIVTIPFGLFETWANEGFTVPPSDYIYEVSGLAEIPYHELSLDGNWEDFDIHHELTDKGIAKFWEDWKSIVS